MSTVVTVLDRPGWSSNTDVIVVVQPRLHRLVWVPRDLFARRHRCRINAVFALDGHDGLLRALQDLGLRARHSVCLQRELVERLLADVSVEVPVARPLAYWYPLTPQASIEEGRRMVRFDPPDERLEGVRIHEWLGARVGVDRMAGDIERLQRQQVFVRALLSAGFDPQGEIEVRPDLWSSNGPGSDPGSELRAVTAAWSMTAIQRVVPATYEGQKVLLHLRLPGRLGRWEADRKARRAEASLD